MEETEKRKHMRNKRNIMEGDDLEHELKGSEEGAKKEEYPEEKKRIERKEGEIL